jgi:hypothetical protein
MERDREFLANLIAADPFHRESVNVDWWYNNPPGEDAWAVEDEHGNVVLYFKTQTACRFSLQFTTEDRRINWKVLTDGLEWLAATLTNNQFREIITDSNGPELRAMATKRLGFLPASPETLTRPLPPRIFGNRSAGRQGAEDALGDTERPGDATDAATGRERPLTPRVN